jgi:periplasmic protein TonB
MRRAMLLAALLLAACGAPTPPAPEKPAAPPPAPIAVAPAPPAPPQAAVPKLPPPRTPLDAYKRDVAQRILSANSAQTFEGTPPEILQAVVVLQFTIERSGTLTGLKTLRSRHPPQEKVALASVRAAAPFPAPPAALLRSSRVEVAETWLFRDDGKFQIRSLAEPQAASE